MNRTNDMHRRRAVASIAFIVLLALSVFWPLPVVTLNELVLHRHLAVDNLSFLGREQPVWDVVFWCLTGLFTLILLHRPVSEGFVTLGDARQQAVRLPAALRAHGRRQSLIVWSLVIGASSLLIAAIFRFADAPVTAWAERVQSGDIQSWIRIANRFGGGMNPAMITLFFLLGGMAFLHVRWIKYALAMALGGLGAGLLVQIVKFAVGRTRPELWLGPHYVTRAAASSFPSGHTVGAFAIAGVLIFGSRSLPLRLTSALLAVAVGLSRILAFRHWMSDVVASAILGLAVSWFVVSALVHDDRPEVV